MIDNTSFYADDVGSVSKVSKEEGVARVVYLNREGPLSVAEVTNTENGFIARFPAVHSTQQDYYVCLDYAQARDLVLGLAEFKKQLGFQE